MPMWIRNHSAPPRSRTTAMILGGFCVFLAGCLPSSVKPDGADMNTTGRVFYVSASLGNDDNDGLSPEWPWRGLERVNATPLGPGDRVLFKRGDTWRGQLVPQSGQKGAPITYGAYGEGDKPVLLGSVSRSDPGDWCDEGNHIWATVKPVFTERAPLSNFAAVSWSVHAESGAQVKTAALDGAPAGGLPGLRIECAGSGSAGNHVQLSTRSFPIKEGEYYLFAFRARCTKPFTLRSISLMKQGRPWTGYGGSNASALAVGPDWAEHSVRFKAGVTADDARITLYLGGALPAGAVLCFQPVSMTRMQCNTAEVLSIDVGNVIFDHGQSVGVKKWKPSDLKRQGDYWYDGADWQVKIYSERNPAELHRSIELALRRHIVSQGGKSHVAYESLALRYGAAHGFGGGATAHIVIRDCDISYIGGGHQFTTPDGRPVRFGNGIEFWDGAGDCLVEGCRIWEIYDAALTNQGGSPNVQEDIIYRNNVIWNSEYSFEYWNRPESSKTRRIRFENNTCVNAGWGWGHAQRPDRNGRHLMFYHNQAETTEFSVRNNLFYQATESCLRMGNDWSAGLTMDHNCWFQPAGALIVFLKESFTPAQFAEYQSRTRMDARSIVADPKFVNVAALDFRLCDDSPARGLSADGGPAGSRMRLQQ